MTGDGSQLRGRVEFAGDGDPQALEVTLSAFYPDGDSVARAGVVLRWLWWDQAGLASGSGGWTPLEPPRVALPLDGCMPFAPPVDPNRCDPWTEHDCCTDPSTRVDYVRPTDFDSDLDAGAL